MDAVALASSEFYPPGFVEWRDAARAYLQAGASPENSTWGEAQLGFAPAPRSHAVVTTPNDTLRVPRRFMRSAITVACHRDARRWDLLYRVLWRLTHGERQLLAVATDPDIHHLYILERAVRRAAHKMKAFVRFRHVQDDQYVAWFEPAHFVVERTAPFFAQRFPSMRWSILTPDRCAHWDGRTVSFTEGVSPPRDTSDALEDLWRDYYASIFNPARLAPGVMRAEMPKTYWKNLPEARLIPTLSRDAPARVARMVATIGSPPQPLPDELRAPGVLVPLRPRAPRTALDLPSWDPVHDPGWEVARERGDAVPLEAAKIVRCGDVTVMPGVAGWTDSTLLAPGVFYPSDASTPEARLRFYAARYAMVEVDSTYYAMPRREHAVAWVNRTPADFIFNVKANALMTGHAADVRQLPDWLRRALPRHTSTSRIYGRDIPGNAMEEVWRRFLSALDPLVRAKKLGAIFLQFPRWFAPTAGAERMLREAARRLGDVRGAVELRNPAWVASQARAERTFGLLEECGLAYTVVDAPPGTRSSMPPIVRVTRRDFASVRLHGQRVATWESRNPFVTERYRYLYTKQQIAEWARLVDRMADAMGRGMVQVSFNNNHANYATTNAAEFGEELRTTQSPSTSHSGAR